MYECALSRGLNLCKSEKMICSEDAKWFKNCAARG